MSFQIPILFISYVPILFLAAFFHKIRCFRTLLNSGADTSLRTAQGFGLSHFAAAGGSEEIIQIIDFNPYDSEFVDDNAEFTPVHAAAAFGHADLHVTCLKKI